MARSRDFLLDIWRNNRADHLNPVLFVLFLLSLAYRSGIAIRSLLYRAGLFQARRLERPVISIGNITVGGTGKTPAVILLSALFRAKGFHPAILSRGYGGKSGASVHVVSDGKRILSNPEDAGDEPFMMASAAPDIPVVTGTDRYTTGKYAIDRLGADLLFLDDAFQHWGLARDVDIVLLNANAPFGNGFTIPRGPLREPAGNLKRAHVLVLTGTGPDSNEETVGERRLKADFPGIPVLRAAYQMKRLSRSGETYPINRLKNKKVVAFCGLANPDSFRHSLEDAGAKVVSFTAYPDHFRYSRNELRELEEQAGSPEVEMIVTTEKDGVKLRAFPDFFREIYILRIDLEISPEGALEKLIEKHIRA